MEKKNYTTITIICAVIIWGMNPTIVKLGLKNISVFTFNTIRFIIASIVCWILLLVRENDWRVEKKDLINILTIGFIGHFIYQIFYIYGISNTTAGNASLIFGALPVIVAFINVIFKIEKLNYITIIGIIISFIGITLVVLGTEQETSFTGKYFLGNVMIFMGTFAWGVYTIINKKYLKKYSSLKLTTYGITTSMIFMCILWSKQILLQDWSRVSFGGVASIIYSGTLSIAIASVFWSIGVSKIGSTKTSVYNNITPVISVICGMIFLDERYSFLQGIGAILIFIGLGINRKNKKIYLILNDLFKNKYYIEKFKKI